MNNTIQQFWHFPDIYKTDLSELDMRISYFLNENYIDHSSNETLRNLYYTLRPIIPSQLKHWLQRRYRTKQEAITFPKWPKDDTLLKLYAKGLKKVLTENNLDKIAYLHFWPKGKKFACVLTHDVETKEGFERIREIAGLEYEHNIRSSFNIIPEKYDIDYQLLEKLRKEGYEIGIHGLKHDGKLFSSEKLFKERAKRINHHLRKFQAVGFRSPLTHRNAKWMQLLDIEYDTSYFDTDCYQTYPGGTLSIFPFFMKKFIELPYTLPQDHTLLEVQQEITADIWIEKSKWIIENNGMILLLTHPDYLDTDKKLAIYEDFLIFLKKNFIDDGWFALPKEVARWWRKRSNIRISPEGEIIGDVDDDARVVWV